MSISKSLPSHMRKLGFTLAVAATICTSTWAVQNDDFFAATTTLPATLYRVNWPTANTLTIGTILNIEPVDIAASPSGVLYGCTVDELYTIDPATGATALVGPVPTFFALEGLEFSSAGILYACNFNGQLMTLNPLTGSSTPLFNLPVIYSGDLASLNATTLYALIDGANGTELLKLDFGAGNHVFLGAIAAGVGFDSLDFDGNGNLIAISTGGDIYRIPNYLTSGTGVFIGAMTQSPMGPVGGMTLAFGGCPAINSYCTSGTTSSGCLATITGTGTPSASLTSGFVLTVNGTEALKQGILFYGLNNSSFAPQPWGGGSSYLCVKAPAQRMGTQNTGGTGPCTGSLTIDWNTFVSSNPNALGVPISPGQPVFAQGWFRDPPSAKTTSLSDGLSFIVCQ